MSMSPIHPRRLRLLALLLLLIAPACSSISTSEFGHDIDDLLNRGRAYTAELSARRPSSLSDAEVISLGYLERARLGMGSPFRLVAYVRRDARLEPQTRETLAYALLAYTLDGRGYQIDPAVLEPIRLAGVPARQSVGRHHLRLMEQAVTRSPTPGVGERALRLGYLLAETERTVEGAPPGSVAHVAALIADRARARLDAAELLREAGARGADPLKVLEERRRQLNFRVEQPALAAIPAREEILDSKMGLQVALAARLMAQRLSAPLLQPTAGQWSAAGAAAGAGGESFLGPETAKRLDVLTAKYDYPPQAPVAVAVAINSEALLSRPNLESWQEAERRRFVETAWNEERFAAAAARLRATSAGAGPRLPLIQLQAAVFLRSWNQEEPWVPGDPAPAAKELEARFGLADLVFDDQVPEHWRPYYRRALARAFADLQRVMPTASLRGLTVRVGALSPESKALALHDPGSRTIVLPPQTGAGTLAHEIAHDLDWQLARRRYGRRGGYATDLAVRSHPSDRLAASLSGLAASLLREGGDSLAPPHESRPAEVFARGADWFVAAALAREGRMGGYLTSFQDAAITGYGTTRSPDVGGKTVPTLFAIFDHMAPVVPETRQWALDTYGPGRTLGAKEIARTILTAGAGQPALERLAAIETARARALTALGGSACQASATEDTRRLLATRHEVIVGASEAAARGAVVDGVRALASEFGLRSAVDGWLAWRLYGAPEPAEPLLDALVPEFELLLARAEEITRAGPVIPGRGFSVASTRPVCSGNPFAAREAAPDAGPRAAFPF